MDILEEIEWMKKQNLSYQYALLDRMRADCRYYFGNGNKKAKDLWGNDEETHIICMLFLWDQFQENAKPQWLKREYIFDYGRQMDLNMDIIEEVVATFL